MKTDKVKIFGLGFHKTGSTTLETALITLGYDVVGKYDQLFEPMERDEWEAVDAIVSAHDGFRDMHWPLFYRQLDERYPAGKFILTARNPDRWLASCRNLYKNKNRVLFERIYWKGCGCPVGNEGIWRQRFIDHNAAVTEYFRDRPHDFLQVNWEDGDGWKELCAFLEKPIPARPFPHANKGKYSLWEKAVRRLYYLVAPSEFKRKNRDL